MVTARHFLDIATRNNFHNKLSVYCNIIMAGVGGLNSSITYNYIYTYITPECFKFYTKINIALKINFYKKKSNERQTTIAL